MQQERFHTGWTVMEKTADFGRNSPRPPFRRRGLYASCLAAFSHDGKIARLLSKLYHIFFCIQRLIASADKGILPVLLDVLICFFDSPL